MKYVILIFSLCSLFLMSVLIIKELTDNNTFKNYLYEQERHR